MALNYTISYVFAPNTTIASSQVNTNFSDNANTWTGLEALTKTLAKLKIDVDPATALEAATKQYVDHYSTYRRPGLTYNSSTVVNIEVGTDGISGDCRVLFPDGNLRIDTMQVRTQCNLAQVAALSGAAQSGLQTGTVVNNTWYAIYAVKTSDNASNFVAVASTVLNIPANFTTLNSNFGANSWVYIGMIRYGDQSGTANAILKFNQAGNTTTFLNSCVGAVGSSNGLRLATGNSVTQVTWTYATGTLGAVLPNNILMGCCLTSFTGGGTAIRFETDPAGAGNNHIWTVSPPTVNSCLPTGLVGFVNGIGLFSSTSTMSGDIFLNGFIDSSLGVGANPLM